MGRLMSRDFGRDGSRPDHCHRSGPCRRIFSFHPWESCEHRNVRWQHGRPVGSVTPTKHPSCCAHAVIGPCPEPGHKQVGRKLSLDDQRGACHRARIIAPQPCIRSLQGDLTMMQSCASAAKLRGGGPILENGVKPWPASGDRHLGSSSETDDGLFARLRELVLPASSLHAARKTTPAGTSPVVTIRHSAMSSFLARATIRVLRVPPWASAVRARYHCASALSF